MIWRRKNSFFLKNEIIIDQVFLVCVRRRLCPDAACVLSGANQMFVISAAANEWINSARICGRCSSWACVRLSCRALSTPTGSVTTCGRLSWTTWSSERWPTWWRWTRSRLSPVTGRANPCKTNWINGEWCTLVSTGGAAPSSDVTWEALCRHQDTALICWWCVFSLQTELWPLSPDPECTYNLLQQSRMSVWACGPATVPAAVLVLFFFIISLQDVYFQCVVNLL